MWCNGRRWLVWEILELIEYTSGASKLYDVINLAIIPQKPKTVKPSDQNWSQVTKYLCQGKKIWSQVTTTETKWQKLKPNAWQKLKPNDKTKVKCQKLEPSDNKMKPSDHKLKPSNTKHESKVTKIKAKWSIQKINTIQYNFLN